LRYVRGIVVCKRSHHRRRMLQVAALFVALILVASVAAWRLASAHDYLQFSFESERDQSNSSLPEPAGDSPAQIMAGAARPGRVVYPYSVVAGGVQDAAELQQASAQDRVVSSHFAGFDYSRARTVRLQEAKQVYLSYRIGNRVFWTRKKVRLHPGEKLISDGKITARTRCANRVSETKQADVSPLEPAAEKFEHPIDEGGSATQFHFPSQFDSALLGRPQMPDPMPMNPGARAPLAPFGGGYLPGIAPPPLPAGACESSDQEKNEAGGDNEKTERDCPLLPKPTPPPATVPEPGTLLLLSSGLAGVYFRYRRHSEKRYFVGANISPPGCLTMQINQPGQSER
jgi:hypothetical protein